MSKEMTRRVHFHTADLDMEKFYRDHIPKSHLPSDYGGDLETVAVLHEKSYERMLTVQDYFTAEEKIVYNDEVSDDED